MLAFPSGRLPRLFAVPLEQAASHGPDISDNRSPHPIRKKATPNRVAFLRIRSLAMTYSHMGKPHTTIGDASFHF
jgi:hypothetical protein